MAGPSAVHRTNWVKMPRPLCNDGAVAVAAEFAIVRIRRRRGHGGPVGHRGAGAMTVLVTGGAGYIGSHMVWELLDAGEERGRSRPVCRPASTGRLRPRRSWSSATSATAELVGAIIRDNNVDAIIHFAGSIVVPESVADPLGYYENNTSRRARCSKPRCAKACPTSSFPRPPPSMAAPGWSRCARMPAWRPNRPTACPS